MGNSVSVNEKLLQLSSTGQYHQLRTLLDEQAATHPEYRSRPAALLDVTDSQGNTPLILASREGHFQVAELLLQRGASIDTQSPNPRGGTALHEAVRNRNGHLVELLIRHGASPFVENAKSFTPMDFACEATGADLLRRLETQAQWRGWLQQKVPRLGGLGAEWQRRWVVICHRLPSPFALPERRVAHVVLLCYKSTSATHPACRAWLDGARADEAEHPRAAERTGGRRPAQVKLRLHRRHPAPSGSHTTGNTTEGFYLHFRPDGGSAQNCAELAAFLEAVNRRAPTPATTTSTGGGGGRHAHGATSSAPAAYQRYTPGAAPGLLHIPTATGAAASGAASSMPSILRPSAPTASAVAAAGTGGGTGGAAARPSPQDEALARRLQEESDAELARRIARLGSDGLTAPPSGAAATGRAATDSLNRPPVSQPSVDVGAFYPSIEFANSAANAPARPSGGGKTPAAAAPSKNNNNDNDDDKRCCICLDNNINTGFVHAGTTHVCACWDCAEELKQNALKYNKQFICPKCRAPVESLIKVYLG